MTDVPTLPANLDAERAVLGSIFYDRDGLTAVAPYLEPDFFYLEKHRRIFSAMLDCLQRRVPPDLITVHDVLLQRGQAADIGGVAGLADLTDDVPHGLHVEYYAEMVLKYAGRRELLQALGDLVGAAYDDDETIEDIASKAHQALQRWEARRNHSNAEEPAQQAEAFLASLQRGGVRCVSTGLGVYDRQLKGGMREGQLIIIAARPSVGKTAHALFVAQRVAAAGGRVLFFSLEMPAEALNTRRVAMMTGIDASEPDRLTDAELVRVNDAAGRIAEQPLYIYDTDNRPAFTIAEIRAACLKKRADVGQIDLVVVDYLQLVHAPGFKPDNRTAAVSEISRSLKQLAGEVGAPVMALSQLNRAVEGRADKVPQLSDLRESGSIEQDADIVGFVYREEMYVPTTAKKGIAEIVIAKHRNGAIGVVTLRFDPATGRWSDGATYAPTPGGYHG